MEELHDLRNDLPFPSVRVKPKDKLSGLQVILGVVATAAFVIGAVIVIISYGAFHGTI